jgi:beta-barrel assembly-enhancing protease
MIKHHLKQLYFRWWHRRRSWLYASFSLVLGLTIVINNLQPSYSASVIELLMQGAQIFELSSIDKNKEIELGKQIDRELLSSGKVNLYRNSQLNSYISYIGNSLAKNSKRPDLPYKFQIVDDPNINAFATMGGFVYVHSGLIAKADNEAQLASVMAHEIGHIGGKHALKQMRDSAIAQGVLSATGLNQQAAVQIGVDLALSKPNSRQDEFEADRYGVETLRKTGYATIGAVEFMNKLLQNKSGVPTFLSTHPATTDRVAALKKLVEADNPSKGKGLDSNAYRRSISSL